MNLPPQFSDRHGLPEDCKFQTGEKLISSESSDFSRFVSFMNTSQRNIGNDNQSKGKFIYSSAHLRDLTLLKQ